jgi:hypothetical protein
MTDPFRNYDSWLEKPYQNAENEAAKHEAMLDWLEENYPSYAALCQIEGENGDIQAAIDAARESIEEWAWEQR